MAAPLALPAILAAGHAVVMTIDGVVTVATKMANILNSAMNLLPTLEEDCEVTVHGNPQSSLWNLYWMAVAVAFGQIGQRRANDLRLLPPAGMIYMEYQLEQKRVRFMVKQNTNWAHMLINDVIAVPNRPVQLFGGPSVKSEFKGGPWNWTAAALPNFSTFDPPYKGKIILTDQPIFNNGGGAKASRSPTPDLGVEGRARGGPTIASSPDIPEAERGWYTAPEYLVFSALAEPCDPAAQLYLPFFTTPVPAGTTVELTTI